MDALLRRRMMIAVGGSPTPPPTPTYVPYIRNTVGAYIDTGISVDSDTKVVVWARNWNPTSGCLFGTETVSVGTGKAFCIGTFGGTNTGRIRIDYANSPTAFADDKFTKLSGYHKYELYQGKISVDDVEIVSVTPTTFTGGNSIHLFGRNQNGAHSDMVLPADICSAKIYKSDVLVRDFTAVNTPSVGLFDSISQTLFQNAGTGSLSFGTFDQNAYTPLDYIECNQAQYFDTGLYGGYAMPMTVVFMPTGTVARWSYMGADTTGSSKRCEIGITNTTYINGGLGFNYQSSANTILAATTNNRLTGVKIVFVKTDNKASAYSNATQIGNTVTGAAGTTFVTDYTMYVGALNQAGNPIGAMDAKFYFAGFGANANFVPAKVGGVAGMYDTYNDAFYPSISGTPFIAGQEI